MDKADYLIGPLAHLVERIHGMDEATGSIPVRSTKLSRVSGFNFVDRSTLPKYICGYIHIAVKYTNERRKIGKTLKEHFPTRLEFGSLNLRYTNLNLKCMNSSLKCMNFDLKCTN